MKNNEQAHIPDKILDEIFPHLPRSSLNRFKSVCKQWNSLISNPNFHHKRTQDECILVAEQSQSLVVSTYSISNNTAVRESKPSPILSEPKKRGIETLVSNSCNGTVIIRFNNYLLSYNPSTGFLRKVRDWVGVCVCIGLCYDDLIQDFKVVVWYKQGLSCFSDVTVKVVVGTVKSQQWKLVRNLPSEIILVKSGCLMNGMIHWIVEEKPPYGESSLFTGKKSMIARSKKILRFRPRENIFEIFSSPNGNESAIFCLGVLGEKLGMARWIEEKIEVLVMKEYGVSKSWTSLFYLSSDFRPFLFTANGDVLLTRKDGSNSPLFVPKGDKTKKRKYESRNISVEDNLPDQLLSYNVNTKKTADLKILSRTNWWDAVSFVFSSD